MSVGCGGGRHCPGSEAEYAWLEYPGVPVMAVGAHAQAKIPWYTFQTTSTDVFDTASHVPGVTDLLLKGAGTYTMEAKVLPSEFGAVVSAALNGTAIAHLDQAGWLAEHNWINTTAPDGAGTLAIRDIATTQLDPGSGGPGNPPQGLYVWVTNYDGVTRHIATAWLKVSFVPSSHTLTQVWP